jgi:hypothetical protein
MTDNTFFRVSASTQRLFAAGPSCANGLPAYSGVWQTASVLLPSGSST